MCIRDRIKTMGGISALAKAEAETADGIDVCYQPENPTSSRISGHRTRTNNLVLKVTRKGRDQDIRTEVVAQLSTTYRFGGMTDFQFLKPTSTAPVSYTHLTLPTSYSV
eukprot:TRINITY_DN12635_c0_g1_i1.p2 TRINITY_DN12635_c0_g1~~TRINITY_DN12635_c0_g1_i1.p2  ORF type:complete len:109 (+),score=33.76 TRINITY_DN12635_c0_g1_i1:78-404(+)